jgi:hypothetical protein
MTKLHLQQTPGNWTYNLLITFWPRVIAPKIFLYFCPEINSWFNITLQCHDIKRVPWISNGIIENVLEYLKSPFKIRFQKKIFLEWGSNPRKYYFFRAEIEKYFCLFLVQTKTAKSPFEIYWPLIIVVF